MFVGTSILEGFWEAFGRVLGGKNHRFSQFFRCFFDVKFEVRSGKRKNAPKIRKKQIPAYFWAGVAVYLGLPGRDYREGWPEDC